MVISEVLRYYPISASVVSRKCMTDTTVHGFDIPKGTNVIADIWTANFDPNIWGPIDPQVSLKGLICCSECVDYVCLDIFCFEYFKLKL